MAAGSNPVICTMRIKRVDFDEDENPSMVTVKMTVDEAAIIARVFGGFNDYAYDATGDRSRWRRAGSEVYSALVGGFFNRFWEDGVNDVLRSGPEKVDKPSDV